MTMKDLRNLDKDDILEMLGLETRQSTGAWLAGSLGTFGVGLLVGAGIALMLAPKPGRELREDLRDRLRRMPNDRSDLPNGEAISRDSAAGTGSGSKSY
jgi:gas vesicle protein